MRSKPLQDKKLFSLQFLTDLTMVTDIGRSIILLVGLLGHEESVNALPKLELIREELLRVPKGEADPSEAKIAKIDAIIEYLRDAIGAVQLSNTIGEALERDREALKRD